MGEVFMRGNIVMKGYLKNPKATEEAFAGGWFHTGDLAVAHPDGYIEIKDRSKDIIISGGENISTIEVEDVLYRHPAVLEAAVVARPDEQWGETPCAFVTLKAGRRPPTPTRSSPSAASIWRISRRRATWSSARCPRPRPARSRNSCCASGRRTGREGRAPPAPAVQGTGVAEGSLPENRRKARSEKSDREVGMFDVICMLAASLRARREAAFRARRDRLRDLQDSYMSPAAFQEIYLRGPGTNYEPEAQEVVDLLSDAGIGVGKYGPPHRRPPIFWRKAAAAATDLRVWLKQNPMATPAERAAQARKVVDINRLVNRSLRSG